MGRSILFIVALLVVSACQFGPMYGVTSEISAEPMDVSVDQIKELQSQLKLVGYDPGPVDGIAGPRTAAAVTEFQAANNMTPDGQISGILFSNVEAQYLRAMEENDTESELQPAPSEDPME